MIHVQIAREELLDSIDPLRHLMQDAQLTPDLLPEQQHSVKNEIIQRSFSDQCNITLAVDASPGCGGVAWPAGEVLSSYLVKMGENSVRGRNILELGSGTGLVGLVAGMLGGKVWITDQAPLLGIMRRNVLLNKLSFNVAVSELNWGSPRPVDIPQPDLILAADCVYFEPAFPLLVQTLADLVNDTTEVLFCYKKRRKADKRFFTLLRKKFTWTEVSDDPDREIYTRQDRGSNSRR